MKTHRWIALCYHDVQPEMPKGGGGPSHFTTSLPAFERMLDTIADRGYTGCSLEAAIARKGERRVAITFDDGNLGQYEYAFPALRSRGMTATFYITTDWVGKPDFVTWDQLREMQRAGMSIQSHTQSHPFLSELPVADLKRELAGSREIIDGELGTRTTEIAFPGGDAPAARLRNQLSACGYSVPVGSRWGINSDRAPFSDARFTKRCSMRGELSAEMAERIVSADRWLRVQHATKEGTLRRLRATLGPTRYAQMRRRVLDKLVRA